MTVEKPTSLGPITHDGRTQKAFLSWSDPTSSYKKVKSGFGFKRDTSKSILQ